MERNTEPSWRRGRTVALVLAIAGGVAIGWWGHARQTSREPTPDLQLSTAQWGRLPTGGGWYVDARFVAIDVGDRQVALEAYAYHRGARLSERVAVPAGSDRARVELHDPPRMDDGKWLALGWWPGPAWVRLVLLDNGRRAYASDEWPIDLLRGDGYPGAFPVPLESESKTGPERVTPPTPQGASPAGR